MLKKNKEITDHAMKESILREADVCRLAMCDGAVPYIVPVFFAYDGGTLYFHCAPEGRKTDLIMKCGNVSFEAETGVEIVRAEKACGYTAKYRSVIGYGTASTVSSPAEKRKALDLLMNKYAGPGGWDYTDDTLARTRIMKIAVTEMSGKKSGY
jgi:uncharacterized protein